MWRGEVILPPVWFMYMLKASHVPSPRIIRTEQRNLMIKALFPPLLTSPSPCRGAAEAAVQGDRPVGSKRISNQVAESQRKTQNKVRHIIPSSY